MEKAIRQRLRERSFERIERTERKPAAVLIPLLPAGDGFDVLFEIRNKDIRQGGEICFPGGVIEDDETPLMAAKRETMEELLLTDEDSIEILAPMHILPGPGGASLYSYAAILHDYEDTYSKDEVGAIIRIPLQDLLEQKVITAHADMTYDIPEDFPFHLIDGGRDYPWSSAPRTFYFYERDEAPHIWGITGELLYRFLETIREEMP